MAGDDPVTAPTLPKSHGGGTSEGHNEEGGGSYCPPPLPGTLK